MCLVKQGDIVEAVEMGLRLASSALLQQEEVVVRSMVGVSTVSKG